MYEKMYCMVYNQIFDERACFNCEFRKKQDLHYEERRECVFYQKIKD